MVKVLHIWLILSCIAAMFIGSAASAGGGDAAPPSFAEFCRGDLPADRSAKFYAELDQADQALAAGNTEAAGQALANAWWAASRGGGETDVSVRCLGEKTTRRWVDTRLELWRRGSSAGTNGGMGRDYATIYVAAADRGTDGVVDLISNRPAKDFVWAYQSVENIIEVDDWGRKYGTLILPEETAAVQACRDALGPLREYAKSEHARTLAAEDEAFDRPPTQMERDALESLSGIGALAGSMGGADMNTPDQQELLMTERRVDESRDLLEVARSLEVSPVFVDSHDRKPSSLRAEQRGDTLLARANDESRSLKFRDEVYDLAAGYYGWCTCRDKTGSTAQARAAIQPALIAEEERRQRTLEAKQAELQQQAAGMQKTMDDMQKTDAEKQSFKDEADALEDELDF